MGLMTLFNAVDVNIFFINLVKVQQIDFRTILNMQYITKDEIQSMIYLWSKLQQRFIEALWTHL